MSHYGQEWDRVDAEWVRMGQNGLERDRMDQEREWACMGQVRMGQKGQIRSEPQGMQKKKKTQQDRKMSETSKTRPRLHDCALFALFRFFQQCSGAFSSVLVLSAGSSAFMPHHAPISPSNNWSHSSSAAHFKFSFHNLLRLFFRVLAIGLVHHPSLFSITFGSLLFSFLLCNN